MINFLIERKAYRAAEFIILVSFVMPVNPLSILGSYETHVYSINFSNQKFSHNGQPSMEIFRRKFFDNILLLLLRIIDYHVKVESKLSNFFTMTNVSIFYTKKWRILFIWFQETVFTVNLKVESG